MKEAHLECRDDAVRKTEEAAAEAASSRQQISAAAERAASLRSKMESLRGEADAARQVSAVCLSSSPDFVPVHTNRAIWERG